MALTDIFQNQVNLPVIGAASLGVVLVAGLAIWFLTRRKKNISLRF